MAVGCRRGQPSDGLVDVGFASGTGLVELAEHELGLPVSSLGGLLHEGEGIVQVALDAPSVEIKQGKVVCGAYVSGTGRLPEQLGRPFGIWIESVPPEAHFAEEVHLSEMSLGGGFLEPLPRFSVILFGALSAGVHEAEVILCLGIAVEGAFRYYVESIGIIGIVTAPDDELRPFETV